MKCSGKRPDREKERSYGETTDHRARGGRVSEFSRCTGDRGKREARTLKQSTVTFGVLVAAFALYQLYREMLMEIPEDAFTLTTGVIYVALVGISGLVLTDRRWAWWIVSTFVLFLLSVGVFYYYPVVATTRDMGPIDWPEGSVYMSLLSVAEFVCVLRLLGASLVPKKG